MVSSHILPVTDSQARLCKAPKVELQSLNDTQAARAAGNSMSVPCVASMCLAAIMTLDLV